VADEISIVVRAEDQFSNVLGNFGSIITGIESVINLATRAFDALVMPIVEYGQEAILAAARVNELKVVNQVLADNAGLSGAAVAGAADAVRAMGIEAGVSQKVIAEFIKANLDIGLAADIARIAQDAAVISGLNSTEVTERIIHGITTLNPLVLRNAGIIVDLQLAYKEWADEQGRSVESLTTAEKQMITMNAVIEAGTGIAGAYAAAMEEPGKVLRSFPRYFDDILVAIGEPFQDAFAEVIFSFADLAKWLGKAVSEGGEFYPMISNIASVLSGLGGTLANVVEAIMNGGIEMLFVQFEDGSNYIGAFIEHLGVAEEKAYAFGNAINRLVTDFDLSTITSLFVDWASSVDWDKLSNDIAGGINSIDWGKVGNEISSGFINIMSGLGVILSEIDWEVLLSSVAQALGDLFAGLVGYVDWDALAKDMNIAFEDAMSTIEVDGKKFYQPIIDAIYWGKENIGDPMREVGLAIVDGIVNLFWDAKEKIGDPLRSLGLAALGFIGEAFMWGKDEIGDPLRQMFLNLIAWAKDEIGDPMRNIGKDIVIGLINGIFSMLSWVTNMLSVFVNSFVGFFKSLLGISSPSTVFANIAKDLVGGLIAGWSSVFNNFLNLVGSSIQSILDLFAPILSLFGIDLGTTGGTTGGRTGTQTPPGGGTGGTGTNGTVNNYFYGPVYIGSSLDDANYDCPSPNPIVAASGNQLVVTGY
jgi:hypothetical protein